MANLQNKHELVALFGKNEQQATAYCVAWLVQGSHHYGCRFVMLNSAVLLNTVKRPPLSRSLFCGNSGSLSLMSNKPPSNT